jgi:hypothetical protein
LSFASESEVDLLMDADDGTTVTWRFTRTEAHGIGVINGPEGFAAKAFAARREPFPAGAAAQDAIEQPRAELRRRWDEDHEAD